ncbi:hypothetical protein D3C83_149310 [compost metagenome]
MPNRLPQRAHDDAGGVDDAIDAYDLLLGKATDAALAGVACWDDWRASVRRQCPPDHLEELDGDLIAIELLVTRPPKPR